jgi:transcription elongation factor Elf1
LFYIDQKYASLVGARLRNFKQKKDNLWNYSCPICGDSSKNKLKARGYIYRKKNDLFTKCHNCASSMSLGNFIKYVDPNLYDQYVMERYKEGAAGRKSHKDVSKVTDDIFKDNNTLRLDNIKEERQVDLSLVVDESLETLSKVDELPADHPVRKWIEERKIPQDKWNLLYFAPKFKEFTNSLTPKFAEPIQEEHPRLIIPFFNEHGKMFAFQARAFGKETPKYYTIKLDEDAPKIYGMERVDFSKTVYVVEGPIDSLFLPNAIAVAGASFDTPYIQGLKSIATIVMDNEPRSKEITKLLDKYIENGYNVSLFPETIAQKDINEMVLAGMAPSEITEVINTNTHKGIEAKLKFTEWKKI